MEELGKFVMQTVFVRRYSIGACREKLARTSRAQMCLYGRRECRSDDRRRVVRAIYLYDRRDADVLWGNYAEPMDTRDQLALQSS